MSLISFSLSSLEKSPSSSSKGDRFIPTRLEFEDFADHFDSSEKKTAPMSEEMLNDENQTYSALLTSNLHGCKTRKRTGGAENRLFSFGESEPADLNPLVLKSPSAVTTKPRRFPKSPFKVLEAPNLQDDFYLNVVDWSRANVLAVGLGSAVYTWNFHGGAVSWVMGYDDGSLVSSVCWDQLSEQLVVGSMDGRVSLWDASR